jgi:hypothetical protein
LSLPYLMSTALPPDTLPFPHTAHPAGAVPISCWSSCSATLSSNTMSSLKPPTCSQGKRLSCFYFSTLIIYVSQPALKVSYALPTVVERHGIKQCQSPYLLPVSGPGSSHLSLGPQFPCFIMGTVKPVFPGTCKD